MAPVEKDLAKNLNEVNNNIKFENTDDAIRETIKNLNKIQLANYIDKSFRNARWEWKKYSDMKKNKFYPFMVQAGINLLNGKDNKIGSFTREMKHMHEYMMSNGGIDNVYWPALKNIVEKIQGHRMIQVDGLAGPQFLARMCWYLTGNSDYIDPNKFQVEGDASYGTRLSVDYYHNTTQEKEAKKQEKQSNNGHKENHERVIINQFRLQQVNNFYERPFYWIPYNISVYTRTGKDGYYYIEGNLLNFAPNPDTSNEKPKTLNIDDYLNSGNENRKDKNEDITKDNWARWINGYDDAKIWVATPDYYEKLIPVNRKNMPIDQRKNYLGEIEKIKTDKQKNTFKSLLNLNSKIFWKGYKLTQGNIQDFIRWMEINAFDKWKTVFHPEWKNSRGSDVFEVDWTSSIWHLADRRFHSVKYFFDKLYYRIHKDHEWK